MHKHSDFILSNYFENLVIKYTIIAIIAITTKIPSIPCPISFKDNIKATLSIIISSLSEQLHKFGYEVKYHTARKNGSDLTRNVCTYGMHEKMVL